MIWITSFNAPSGRRSGSTLKASVSSHNSSTSSTCALFQTGSKTRLASRTASRFWTVAMPKDVVDPEDGALAGDPDHPCQQLVQPGRTVQVLPEGLHQHDAAAGWQADAAQRFDRGG